MSILSKFLRNMGLVDWDMPNPELYPDNEIYNYPFDRNNKGRIKIRNDMDREAWCRVVDQNQKRFEKNQITFKKYSKMMDDYGKGLISQLDQNLVDKVDKDMIEESHYIKNYKLSEASKPNHSFKYDTGNDSNDKDYAKDFADFKEKLGESMEVLRESLRIEHETKNTQFHRNSDSIWIAVKPEETIQLINLKSLKSDINHRLN